MKKVCVGSVSNPAISTVNIICYGGKDLKTAPVMRGKRLEPVARTIYTKKYSLDHKNVSVTEAGLYISQAHPFIAASPDGIVKCSCHHGVGGLEIKTTSDENKDACLDATGQLKKDHSFYYQIQTQIYVCGLSFCDLFVYTGKSQEKHRVLPDAVVHEEIVNKSRAYFSFVILPELVAKHFSLNSQTAVGNLLRDTTNLGTIICSCRNPKAGRTVVCAGKECRIGEFHYRYVGLLLCLFPFFLSFALFTCALFIFLFAGVLALRPNLGKSGSVLTAKPNKRKTGAVIYRL